MDPSEFLDVLERLQKRLSKNGKPLSAGERRSIRALVGAWFGQYKASFLEIVGEEKDVAAVDSKMQDLLKLTHQASSCRLANREISRISLYFRDTLLLPLSRAHWSRAPEKTPAGRDDEMLARLRAFDSDLADGYEQAVLDIEEEHRLSYRGPAAELREVVTGVLHKLAPTAEVQATDWYKEARKSGSRTEPTPTRAERTKFILRSRAKGSATTETAETFMTSVEDRLASVVNATYKRGATATHVGTERAEMLQLLPYVNALLRELLP